MPRVAVRSSFRKIYVITGVVLLTVGVVVSIVLVKMHQSQTARQRQAENTVLKEAQMLDNTQQYVLETRGLQDYIDSNPPEQYRYSVLLQLGVLALNRQDYVSALKWYKQAETASGKVQLQDAAGAGEAEAALGHKQAAIGYYKQAANLSNTSNLGQTNYAAIVKTLESSP
jgi:tetratricopeptide (TPR) repeat protein